jgi:hypothetical protein
MKKTLIYACAALMLTGLVAEAKKDKNAGKKGKPDKEMKQAKEPAGEKTADQKKPEKAGEKGRSEDMKKATAEKKEAQKAAKESGEKMDKENKSWWKFWK